jgi:hypothetical protein
MRDECVIVVYDADAIVAVVRPRRPDSAEYEKARIERRSKAWHCKIFPVIRLQDLERHNAT